MLTFPTSAKREFPGHILRHRVVAAYASPFNIDTFGGGYRPVDVKEVAHQDYAYAIVIENCQVDHYFSEKLGDAIVCGCIPIYWGCPAHVLKEMGFDMRGILCWDTLEDLEEILKTASLMDYESRRDAVEHNLKLFQQIADWPLSIYQRCPELWASSKVKVYVAAISSDFRPNTSMHDLAITLKSLLKDSEGIDVTVFVDERVEVDNVSVTPIFNTRPSHLWNQALMDGFRTLKHPESRLVVCVRAGALFQKGWLRRLLRLHSTRDLVFVGEEDQFHSYLPEAVRFAGLWDESILGPGAASLDYRMRAVRYLPKYVSLNPGWNKDDITESIVSVPPSNSKRDTCAEIVRRDASSLKRKWGEVLPQERWIAEDQTFMATVRDGPKSTMVPLYPYFEADVWNEDKRKY